MKVLTYDDVPNNWYTVLKLINVGYDDEPVLAEDKVLYHGEPIVAVVATTERAAREGAAAVKVTYEDLPHVLDVEEAIKPERPVIKPHGTNYFVYEGHHCRRVRFGDVERGLRARPTTSSSGDYQSRPIEQAPTETTGCIVIPQHNGRLKIHSDTQAAFFTLDNTALILDVPFGKLQVVGGTVGGGFGGKVDVIVEPIACIAAMADQQAGQVRLRPRGGDAGLLAARGRAHLHQGRRDERRAHRRPPGHALRRRRRLLAPQPVRDDQGGGAHARPVHDPERLRRLLVRLHQPHAVERDARVRRHDRRLRAGVARWTGSRGRWTSTRSSCGSRTPTATAT